MKYNKKIWISEEIITDEDLNALEEGLENTNTEVENAKVKDDGTAYPTLKDRLDDIDPQIKNLGNLESGNLEDFATKDYVDEAVSNVEVDLTDYPTKDEMQEAISNVEVDLTDYPTKEEVQEALSNADSADKTLELEIEIVNTTIHLKNNLTSYLFKVNDSLAAIKTTIRLINCTVINDTARSIAVNYNGSTNVTYKEFGCEFIGSFTNR